MRKPAAKELIVADALRHGMDRDTTVEQGSGVDASQVMESSFAEAEQARPSGELLAEVARVARFGERDLLIAFRNRRNRFSGANYAHREVFAHIGP